MSRRPGNSFSLKGAAKLDIGRLQSLAALASFLDAWRSYAADIPILGAASSLLREAHLRLRAKAVAPGMQNIGHGAESVDSIVSTVKHLALPSQLGEQLMFGTPQPASTHVHLVPPDVDCAVCGSTQLELLPSSAVPAQLVVRALNGTRPGTGYKKVCRAVGAEGRQCCGTVHRYNEIEVPAGKRLLHETPEAFDALPAKRMRIDAPEVPGAPEVPAGSDAPGAVDAVPVQQPVRRFRRGVLEQPYFRATRKTFYTHEFMQWTSSLLESVQASFDGVTRTARAVHREVDDELDRVERRNLTTAWFAHEAIEACLDAGLQVAFR